jgi:hypothetical protein
MLLQNATPTGPWIHAANVAIRRTLCSKKLLKRSAKTYLKKVVECVELFQIELTIAKRELQDMKAVVEARKQHRTGKRLLIKDKIVVTTQGLPDGIRAADAETGAKQSKKPTKRIRAKA